MSARTPFSADLIAEETDDKGARPRPWAWMAFVVAVVSTVFAAGAGLADRRRSGENREHRAGGGGDGRHPGHVAGLGLFSARPGLPHLRRRSRPWDVAPPRPARRDEPARDVLRDRRPHRGERRA